jgi:hypothetical protein
MIKNLLVVKRGIYISTILVLMFLMIGKESFSKQAIQGMCPIHNEKLAREILIFHEELYKNAKFEDGAENGKLNPYSYGNEIKRILQIAKNNESVEITYCPICTQQEDKYTISRWKWEYFIDNERNVRIKFPGKPDNLKSISNNKDEVNRYHYSFSTITTHLSLEITEYPKDSFDYNQVQNDFLPIINCSYNGYPCFEETKQFNYRVERFKTILIGNKLYELSVFLPLIEFKADDNKSINTEQIIDEFINSFIILK